MSEQARAARLTAIAEKCERNNDSLLTFGNDYSDVLLDAANALREVSAHVETLTQQVAELTADLADQHKWSEQFHDDAVHFASLNTKAEQQRDAAHAALKQLRGYACHRIGCDVLRMPCHCGLDAALAASAPQKELRDGTD